MRHRAASSFWRCFDKLPDSVQQLARDVFALMKQDPRHPSVHLKKVGRFFSARVGLHHRALGVQEDKNLIWFWIGTHAEYNALIKR